MNYAEYIRPGRAGVSTIFSRIRLQTGLTLVFSAVMLVIILVIYWFIEFFVLDDYEKVMTENIRQLNVELAEQVDLYFDNLNQLSKNSVGNHNLMDDMRQLDRLTNELTQYEILFFDRNFESYSSYLLNYSEMSRSNVYIYGRQNRFKFAYGTLPLKSNFESVYERSLEGDRLPGKAVFYYNNANNEDDAPEQPSISIIRAFSEITGYVLGYIEIQQDYSMLDKIADMGQAGTVYIFDQHGQVVYPAERLDADTIRFLQDVIAREGGLRNGNYFYTSHTSDESGLTTVIKHADKQAFQSFYRLRNVTLIAIVVVGVFTVLSIYITTRQMTKPIRLLRSRVLKVDFDNISLFANRTSPNNEINLLNEAFQQMIDRLKHSMERELAASKEEMKARFSALQSQIAPHFIHNMLYLISISAEEDRKADVINMCKRLSDMLRYMVESPYRNVTLKDEMEYAINYLTLIQYKFEDFITYAIDMPQEAQSVVLPRLTIQPFVENAVKHAFNDSDPPWKISIVCSVEDSEWEAVIEDNGSGIPTGKLSALQSEIAGLLASDSFTLDKSDGMGGLGIINTIMRLKMIYPNSLRFDLHNGANGGTRIRIRASLTPEYPAQRVD